MRKGKRLLGCALGALLGCSLLLGGCNNSMFDFGGWEYPDFPLADSDDTIDSWTQWEEDEIIEIDWFIDSTSYSLPREGSQVVEEILKKTGIKINFRKATTGDGSELTTMIAGNDLTDLVSVTAGMDDLVSGEDVFPINGLAERWAPSLWRRITEEGEMYNTYKDADGNLFYMVNNFYNTGEVEDYRELGGDLLPNDGIVVRKDYLEAFCNYKKSQDASWTDAEMANPDGVFEFLSWTKQEYNLSNANHSVLISAFDSSEKYGSRGIQVLMEYFGCSEEDENGNYAYPQASDNFVEMMQWMNRLYNANLLTEGCLGATQTQINQYIQTGEPIMYIGKMITPSSYFRNWELNVSGRNPAGGGRRLRAHHLHQRRGGDPPAFQPHIGRAVHDGVRQLRAPRPGHQTPRLPVFGRGTAAGLLRDRHGGRSRKRHVLLRHAAGRDGDAGRRDAIHL